MNSPQISQTSKSDSAADSKSDSESESESEEKTTGSPSVFSLEIEKYDGQNHLKFEDRVAVEEPLEIRLDFVKDSFHTANPGDGAELARSSLERLQKSVSITMRTPGHDFDLAVGFLFTEGLIHSSADVLTVSHCGPVLPLLGHSNVVKVKLADLVRVNLKSLERHFYTSSSCGVCGKSSIAALKTQNRYSSGVGAGSPFYFSSTRIPQLPEALRQAQEIFEQTGGLHASAIFTETGRMIHLREDVGRHNALDKLIGAAFLKNELPLSRHVLLVSGRVSFELVQKAAMAGIRMIAAVGAPSSLAVELAVESNMTLIGFVRNGTFNVYTGAERLK